MPCGAKEAGGVYLPAPTSLRADTHRQRLRQAGRPRHPQESPFYQLVERFYPQFEAVYEERYQDRYGSWRPIIGTVVRKFLECGDLKHGFARVRCPKCHEEGTMPPRCTLNGHLGSVTLQRRRKRKCLSVIYLIGSFRPVMGTGF